LFYYNLLQICQRDKFYDSYVEMPIRCRSSVANFTLVTAATLVRPGRRLAARLGLDDGGLLVVAFHSRSLGVASGSALCVFKMSRVRATAADNVRECDRNASVMVGSQFFIPGVSREKYCTVSQVRRPSPSIQQQNSRIN